MDLIVFGIFDKCGSVFFIYHGNHCGSLRVSYSKKFCAFSLKDGQGASVVRVFVIFFLFHVGDSFRLFGAV